MDNAEEYVDLMFDFCMHTGIQKQVDAFRGMYITDYLLVAGQTVGCLVN